MAGSCDRGRIVWTPEPMAKAMTSAPWLLLARAIACRSDPGPESLVLVTVKVARSRRGSSGSGRGRWAWGEKRRRGATLLGIGPTPTGWGWVPRAQTPRPEDLDPGGDRRHPLDGAAP